MDNQHFIKNISLYTYESLKKWFNITVFLISVFFMYCFIVGLPLIWQWHQKKSLYNQKKYIYTQEQELIVEQKTLENNIKELEARITFLHPDDMAMSAFLSIVLEKNEKIAIVSVKKADQKITLEGVGDTMDSIADAVKQLAEKTTYSIRIQSVDKRNKEYVFHAMCHKKK